MCSASSGVIGHDDVKNLHKDWMLKHKRTYASPEEESKRFGVFMNNLEYILEHNVRHTLGEVSFSLEMNDHMDLSFEEYKASKLTYKHSVAAHSASTGHAGTHYVPLIRGVGLPDSVNWVTKGAVTAPKDQGQCGSCWSFSTTGAIEGAHFLATGNLVSLSEEQLINCVNGGQFDCDTGGDMVEAFKYVISNHGLVTEATWPYTLADHQTCKYSSSYSKYAATISSYKTVATNDEDALKSAVAITPVSIAIDASQKSFQFYSSGVYDDAACCRDCSPSDLDHGVLAVGYGTEDGKDYWLVKNSWGSSWGDNGYIKIIRNDNGACGVPTTASYPIV
jgi:cathepsin L